MRLLLLYVIMLIFPYVTFAQSGEWTWMKGNNMPDPPANYGLQGVPAISNDPGARYEPAEWTDKNGNFWFFGGWHAGNNYSDLWKFDPITNMWTWMHGSNTVNQAGSYGSIGVPAPGNRPGAHYFCSASWVDTTGNLWLFGGSGKDAVGNLGRMNDLWKYDIGTNMWTWVNGSMFRDALNNFGTKGVPSPGNVIGARYETSATWVDNDNNLWIFAGNYRDSIGFNLRGNDLWKYDISSDLWTWMSGSDQPSQPGIYGSQGVANSSSMPGARQVYAKWKDLEGNFWIFGGIGLDSAGTYSYLNDLWKYDLTSDVWTWMTGSQLADDPGNFGDQCERSDENGPSARFESRTAWTDSCGNFWLMGGEGIDANGDVKKMNDLWMYDPYVNIWVWISGDSIGGQNGSYGALGVSSPTNMPPSRYGAVSWMGNQGELWLYGGAKSLTEYGDLWKYVPDTLCSPGMLASTSGDTIMCLSDSVTLTASGGSAYTWWPSSGLSSDSTAITKALPLSNTTYYVQIARGNCSIIDSVVIKVNALPDPSHQIEPEICNGMNGVIAINQTGGSGSYSYQWLTGQTADSLSGLPAGTYEVVVTDDVNGCISDTLSFNLSNVPAPVIDSVGVTNPLCFGENTGSIDLTITSSGPANILWSGGQQTEDLPNLPAGNYSIQVTDTNNCTSLASFMLTEPPELILDSSVTHATCDLFNGIASLVVSGGSPGYTFIWNSQPPQTTETATNLAPGVYDVTVEDSNNCSRVLQITVIPISSNPVVNAFPDSISVGQGESITFSTNGGIVYQWLPTDNLDDPGSSSPSLIVPGNASGIMQYFVTGMNADSCFGTDTVTIYILESDATLEVPNIFSPNTGGLNDVLYPFSNKVPDSFLFTIYNRWGEKVFESTDIGTGWDGSKNGESLNNAVFHYFASASFGDIQITRNGTVTLVR